MSNNDQRSFVEWLDGNMERGLFAAPPAFYPGYHETCGSVCSQDLEFPEIIKGN